MLAAEEDFELSGHKFRAGALSFPIPVPHSWAIHQKN